MKNYNVIDPGDEARVQLEALFRRMDSTTGQPCILCGWHKAWGFACGRCRGLCEHTLSIPGWSVSGNAAQQAWARCLRCGRMGTALPRGSTILDICLRDTRDRWKPEPCARCGKTDGSERHHWAPWAIFEDAEEWPTSWLCPECHRIWHNAMRVAKGVSLPEGQRVTAVRRGVA
jgi:hypothetical protein